MAKLLSKYNMIDSLRVLYQMEQAGPDAIFEARARDCYKNLSILKFLHNNDIIYNM